MGVKGTKNPALPADSMLLCVCVNINHTTVCVCVLGGGAVYCYSVFYLFVWGRDLVFTSTHVPRQTDRQTAPLHIYRRKTPSHPWTVISSLPAVCGCGGVAPPPPWILPLAPSQPTKRFQGSDQGGPCLDSYFAFLSRQPCISNDLWICMYDLFILGCKKKYKISSISKRYVAFTRRSDLWRH